MGKTSFVPLAEIKAGDRLTADSGFTCIIPAQVCTVQEDKDGIFVPCFGPDCEDWDTGKQLHKHYLDGQEGDNGECIGFVRADQ